jgi:hypothetical protein
LPWSRQRRARLMEASAQIGKTNYFTIYTYWHESPAKPRSLELTLETT